MTIYLWILAVWFAAQIFTSMVAIAKEGERGVRFLRVGLLIAEVMLGYTALVLLRD